MSWLTLVLVISVALIPPILLVQIFQWAQKRWRLESKPRRLRIYIASIVVWFLVIGTLAYYIVLPLPESTSPIEALPEPTPPKQPAPPKPAPPTGNLPKPAPPIGALPEAVDIIPKFPWPPPAASSFVTIPLRGLLESSWFSRLVRYYQDHSYYPHPYHPYHHYYYYDLEQFSDLDRPLLLHADVLLRFALTEIGHYETSYYSVPDGFALVSRLEQIEEDGSPKPLPARWELQVRNIGHFSLGTYLHALFMAPLGYYRLIVFVVTPHPFSQSSQEVSRDAAESWLRFGSNALPIELAMQPYTKQFICTALIYEFEKFDTQKEPVVKLPGRLPAMTHIEKSGLGKYLQ